MSYKLLVAPLAIGLLSGCNTVYEQTGSPDPGFGEALKYDMAVQTIDPDPVYGPDNAQPGDHGEKGANAVKRYRSGGGASGGAAPGGGATGRGNVGVGPGPM